MKSPRGGQRALPGRAARLVCLFAIALLVGQPFRVDAATAWCARDPTLLVNGRIVQIMVSSPEEILDVTTGPIKVRVRVPVGTDVQLIDVDHGFGFGYDLSVIPPDGSGPADSGGDQVKAKIAVNVPALKETLPVLVVVQPETAPAVEQEGETNRWIRLSALV